MSQYPSASNEGIHNAYFEEAWAMICDGVRPSADKLVGRLGGSKATAVAALKFFWSDEMPKRMRRSQVAAPSSVDSLASELWTEALKLARKEAEALFNDAMAGLDSERARLSALLEEMETRDRERRQLVAESNARAAENQELAREARASVRSLEARLRDMTDERDKIVRTAASLEELLIDCYRKCDQLRDRALSAEAALGRK
jgi:chromosome segregation ATPase